MSEKFARVARFPSPSGVGTQSMIVVDGTPIGCLWGNVDIGAATVNAAHEAAVKRAVEEFRLLVLFIIRDAEPDEYSEETDLDKVADVISKLPTEPEAKSE